jgi:hypothetical protein
MPCQVPPHSAKSTSYHVASLTLVLMRSERWAGLKLIRMASLCRPWYIRPFPRETKLPGVSR